MTAHERPGGWVIPAGSAAAAPFSTCVGPARANWSYAGLRLLDLSPGIPVEFDTGGEEMLAVPLTGGAEVMAGAVAMALRGRSGVFAGHTDRAYLPTDCAVRMISPGGGRIALCTAVADRRLDARYLPAGRIASATRGTGRTSRQVVDLANESLCPAQRLIVCEVYTPAGNTSSTPPHKHDTAGPGETELEEIYYFELDSSGRAHHVTTASDDRAIDVDTDVGTGDIALVPYGWHGPTVAPETANLYYLNVMAGPVRSWQVSFHPTAGPRPDPADPADPRLPLVGAGKGEPPCRG